MDICTKKKKGWNNCSLSQQLCDAEKPEKSSLKFYRKAHKSHLLREQQQAEVAAEYSGRQVDTQLLVLFLRLITVNREGEASMKVRRCVHLATRYEVKLKSFVLLSFLSQVSSLKRAA